MIKQDTEYYMLSEEDEVNKIQINVDVTGLSISRIDEESGIVPCPWKKNQTSSETNVF